jgi:LysM repeat protein
MLLASGCFQQAGESLQPVSSTLIPQDAAPATPLTPSNDNPEQAENNSDSMEESNGNRPPATPTFPPITVISPGDITPNFPTATPLVAASATPDADLDVTQQLITPISPLMANVDDDSTAEPNALPQIDDDSTAEASSGDAGIVTTRTNSSSTTNTSEACTYTVQPGDNLYRIAIANDFSLDAVRDANPDLVGDAPILQVGQVINLPNCGDSVSAPAPTQPAAASSSTPPPNSTAPAGGQTYVVQPGDTLLAIANRFNLTVRDLVEANSLANPDRLSVGQVLIIPVSSE